MDADEFAAALNIILPYYGTRYDTVRKIVAFYGPQSPYGPISGWTRTFLIKMVREGKLDPEETIATVLLLKEVTS